MIFGKWGKKERMFKWSRCGGIFFSKKKGIFVDLMEIRMNIWLEEKRCCIVNWRENNIF